MPEEGPDQTELYHESLVKAVAKHCSETRESDLSTICTRLRYRLLRVSDYFTKKKKSCSGNLLHTAHTRQPLVTFLLIVLFKFKNGNTAKQHW